jgi:potassium-transporting ATPase potassium-binding subunit
MTANGWVQIGMYLVAILLVTRPLGRFMARVFSRERTWIDPLMRPIERAIYRLTGVDENREMCWTEYAAAMLVFSGVSMAVLYTIERTQAWLPLNPQRLSNVPSALAFNTAASFTTNTNWQAYSGESTMSYLTQMAGLAYQNFASAAVGIALAIALIRGIARHSTATIGNFWVDFVRACLWVLLPFSLAGALVLVSQGVVQNLRPYDVVSPIDTASPPQLIAQGPVASQEAIKEWGTNGGGFFNANSSHPFENPTPLTNFVEMFGILAIASALTYTLGDMTKSHRHGWAVWSAMLLLFLASAVVTYWAEARGNPLLAVAGGNVEGKEVRLGIANSALFATATTAASCGAVNAMHDSFTPLGGMMPLVNIMLGEVAFGGVGSGLYGVLLFVILSVFIAGLMVGRTPEYLGKKIDAFDVQMAMLAILIFPLTILALGSISAIGPGLASLNNGGPHGLSEMLYAYTSATGNNGSAFAGLNANTNWYNLSLGIAMLVGRFLPIVAVLAIAGNLARKKAVPPSAGTFPVTTPLFTGLLASVIVIVGVLTFFPVLSLGPIVEHLLMQRGQVF